MSSVSETIDDARRRVLLRGLFGAGLLGLRALATGLPLGLLRDPRRALAQAGDPAAEPIDPQFLIFNTSQAGDPLGCNAPGTYLDAAISHPADSRMQPTSLTIGGASHRAAAPWATLGAVLERTAFIHHSTGTEQHLHEPDVLGLMGKVVDKDMLVSALAAALAPALGTIQAQPVVIGTTDSSEAISFRGRPQPLLNPMSLATVLGSPQGPLGELRAMRDRDLDRLNAFFKQSGTAGQRRFLDQYAQSQAQTRMLSSDLLSELAAIDDNSPSAQVRAAVLLVRMKIAPVITVHIPFGGDNHADGDLADEAEQTVSGMATLLELFALLASAGLADGVTFASLNVFGRSLLLNRGGRNHNKHHHLTLLTGKHVRGGVIGGVVPMHGDYAALPIDSTTGRGEVSGDIPPEQSLASVGHTLGRALGLNAERMNQLVIDPSSGEPYGKLITAAIAG